MDSSTSATPSSTPDLRLHEIWQYPVKSLIGGTVASAALTTDGMQGDRAWAVRDEERGGIRGAKKIGALMQLAARHVDDGTVVITLPGGREVSSDDPQVHAVLSEALDHRVTLWPLQPATDLAHYRRGAADNPDIMVELRDIFGRETDEPLPDLSKFPEVIMEFESPPGTYLDAFPLLVMTTSALAALAAALPDSAIDIRRFRPNLLVDTGSAVGHPEFDWVGRRFAIGSAVIEIAVACPRCVMVTREIDQHVPADRAVLRHIVRDLGQDVGVYATVVQPGTISAGDRLVDA
ncbi:MAG: MOSC domain-containing protein [Actinomycetota bacterium]|nr:MOSC domain-containing protein [Actinomycetota bacterium]